MEKITTSDIIWLFRHYHNVDATNEFEISHIYLVHNVEKDFYFSPLKAGSAEFYRQLYNRLGYSSVKPGYEWAATFILAGDSVLDVGCGYGNFEGYPNHVHYKVLSQIQNLSPKHKTGSKC